MMKKIIELFFKYKTPILYVIFGGITTVINIVTYWLCYDIIGMNNDISNILAWIFSVLVAYITNKIWVFESVTRCFKALIYEMVSFVSCRIATGLIDLAIMHIAVMLHLPACRLR